MTAPRTAAGRALLSGVSDYWLEGKKAITETAALLAILAIEAEAREGLDEAAMTRTLEFLYHADQPCDAPNKHRHDHIAQGIVGQYPRFAAAIAAAYATPEPQP